MEIGVRRSNDANQNRNKVKCQRNYDLFDGFLNIFLKKFIEFARFMIISVYGGLTIPYNILYFLSSTRYSGKVSRNRLEIEFSVIMVK